MGIQIYEQETEKEEAVKHLFVLIVVSSLKKIAMSALRRLSGFPTSDFFSLFSCDMLSSNANPKGSSGRTGQKIQKGCDFSNW